jgi:hypothetical protein
MDQPQESKIAWLAWLLLDEVQTLLWTRYEKQFLDLMRQEQEQNHLKFLLDQEKSVE